MCLVLKYHGRFVKIAVRVFPFVVLFIHILLFGIRSRFLHWHAINIYVFTIWHAKIRYTFFNHFGFVFISNENVL